MAKKTLNVPPFPPLRWDDYGWAGSITLPSWKGFAARPGSRSKKVSDGAARLSVAVEDECEDEERAPPTAPQIAAMKYLLKSEKRVASAVLGAIFEIYPEQKAAYEEDYDEEPGTTLPEISKPSGLRPLMRLSNVHVQCVKKDGAAYIGFEFDCVWEAEHGAGVLTHLGRVVEVGQADCSFLEWIAERDAKRRKKK
jgi:hypothetical protein